MFFERSDILMHRVISISIEHLFVLSLYQQVHGGKRAHLESHGSTYYVDSEPSFNFFMILIFDSTDFSESRELLKIPISTQLQLRDPLGVVGFWASTSFHLEEGCGVTCPKVIRGQAVHVMSCLGWRTTQVWDTSWYTIFAILCIIISYLQIFYRLTCSINNTIKNLNVARFSSINW